MRLLHSILLTAICASAVTAQNKISMDGLQLIGDYKAQQQMLAASRSADMKPVMFVDTRQGQTIPEFVSAAIVLHDNADLSALEEMGVSVQSQRADVALVTLPIARAEAIAALPQVVSLSMGRTYEPMLNYARRDASVSPVQAGTDLPQAYTGKGVVVGLMDVGLDPNHINFADRMKRVWVVSPLTQNSTTVQTYDTPGRIASFTTENAEESHGTHVLGILAGAYKGAGKYGTFSTAGNWMSGTKSIPYYGVATEAEIAAACGSLADICIMRAADLVSEYAQSVGKPAVFNLSCGSNIGPHDGSTALNKYLSDLGKEMIICISAGNEGYKNMSIRQTFSASTPSVSTVVAPYGTSAYLGSVDTWSDNSGMFNLTFAIYDTQTGSTVYEYPLDRNTAGSNVTITSSAYTGGDYIKPEIFNTAFTGYVILRSNIDPNNNRYQVYTYFNISANNSRYKPVMKLSGANGISVSSFTSSGLAFSNGGIAGFLSGSPENSANDMACCDNVIAVGSFNTRERIPFLNGTIGTLNAGGIGNISNFSSYGTQIDGRNIPTLCAPGCTLISSISTYYVQNQDINPTSLVGQTPATATTTSRMNYWDEMSGTSMASPFAAGVAALMLEVAPTLTFSQVRDILVATATRDSQVTSTANQVKWGAGKINALEAIKKTINDYSAIGEVWADDSQRLIITPTAAGYEVFLADAAGFTVTVYDLQGRAVARTTAPGDTACLSSGALSHGVYILEVATSDLRLTRKVIR